MSHKVIRFFTVIGLFLLFCSVVFKVAGRVRARQYANKRPVRFARIKAPNSGIERIEQRCFHHQGVFMFSFPSQAHA